MWGALGPMSMCNCFLGASSVPPWCILGASLVPPWCLLGASSHPLTWSQAPLWRSQAPLGTNLAPTWSRLGAYLHQLGPTWDQLGPTYGQLRSTWDQIGMNLGHLGPKCAMGSMQNHCFPLCFCIFLRFQPSYNLGGNLRQLESNLDPTSDEWGSIWDQLGPTWCQLRST